MLDVREQYSLLPLEETLVIAEACGVKHPKDPHTNQPIVMTTDFVVTISVDGKDVDEARTVKYAGDLNSPRVLEKLEIERRYWEARDVDWKIVTEQQVSKVLARNVEWVHPYRILEEFSTLSETVAAKVIAALTRGVSLKNQPLRDITFDTDRRLRLEAGEKASQAAVEEKSKGKKKRTEQILAESDLRHGLRGANVNKTAPHSVLAESEHIASTTEYIEERDAA